MAHEFPEEVTRKPERYGPENKKELICTSCKEKKSKCAVKSCGLLLSRECFDKNLFDNARKHNRALVCRKCQDKGFSPKDLDTYTCQVCGPHGHLKFEKNHVKNSKPPRSSKLLCRQCSDKEKVLSATLRACLKNKSTWQCTCSKNQHMPSNDKCGLRPSKHGEQRWPGGNAGISLEDYTFLERAKQRSKQ